MSKMGKTVILIVILLLALPLSYIGMLYISATSASYSISSVSFPQTTSLVEVLLTRQLDIKLYLRIEGHGPLSVPIKSFHTQIYLEDVYVGHVQSSEPFSIPSSGTSILPLTFHLDLSSVSLSDIQRIIESISSHNGEVKISFDGYIEPIILFFSITVPIKHSVYVLTMSDAPRVVSMDWSSYSAVVGESVAFHVSVKNVFRGSSINGVLNVIVREDVAYGPDVDARVYNFSVQLPPGESKTFSDSFIPYKGASTQGFFLKVLWKNEVLAEQENKYPPRLRVYEKARGEGDPLLQKVWWTVGDKIVTEAEQGDTVKAHVQIKAVGGAVEGTVTIRIRKDLALLPDEDHVVQSFQLYICLKVKSRN